MIKNYNITNIDFEYKSLISISSSIQKDTILFHIV